MNFSTYKSSQCKDRGPQARYNAIGVDGVRQSSKYLERNMNDKTHKQVSAEICLTNVKNTNTPIEYLERNMKNKSAKGKLTADL